MKTLNGLQDARSNRGIFSRGKAKYGVSGAPKPGSIFNVQKAARNRIRNLNQVRTNGRDRRRI